MLKTSREVVDLISSGSMAPFVLVRLGFNTPLLATDHSTEVSHDAGQGNEFYLNDKGLVSVSPPSALSEVSRDLFDIIFEDAEGTLKQTLDQENVGVPILVTMGFLDMPDATMTTHRLVIYRGTISSVSWGIDEDRSVVRLKCSGPLAKLLQVTNRTTSDASQKRINAKDNAFEYSHDTSSERTLKWGDSKAD